MQTFIVLSALVAVAVAAPGYLSSAYAPYAYHAGAPIGHDGRVVDTPEVEHAKAVHFAAHASESARNSYGYAGYAPALAYVAAAPHVSYPVHHGYAHAAPLAADGRVVDTPEVAHAKAAHLAAHAQEAAKTGHAYGALSYAHSPIYAYGYASAAPIGHDGRVVDTPEVAHAKAAHLAAHAAASHY